MAKAPAISTYRLGHPAGPSGPRPPGALRIAPVRFLPRGVSKQRHHEYFDLWLPLLAPSRELIARLRSSAMTDADFATYARRYERELRAPAARQAIALLAQVAARVPIAIGCYCEDESRCHRTLLRRRIEEAARQ
jgi:uncharacterized protein YeaO (DUF488 family)